jgi:heme/copper-type cytochrome/quinol oxidase subunit 1
MPRLSAYAVRAALIHLVLGFAAGALLLSNKGNVIHPVLWALLPAHIDLLLLGWTAQLAMGVAYWILPRHRSTPKRGNPTLAASSFVALNLGVAIVAISPWIQFSGPVQLAGRSAELLAVALFAYSALRRIAVAQR